MTTGFGILFALAGGSIWAWQIISAPPVYRVISSTEWVGMGLAFALIVSVCFGVGWMFGFAIRRIRHG